MLRVSRILTSAGQIDAYGNPLPKQKPKVDPNIRAIAMRAFPNYKGRTFRHDTSGHVTFYDLNWGGGTRNSYTAVRLSDMRAQAGTVMAPWNNPIEGKTVDIPPGFAIVEHTIFCGKDMGLRVYTAIDPTLEESPAQPFIEG